MGQREGEEEEEMRCINCQTQLLHVQMQLMGFGA